MIRELAGEDPSVKEAREFLRKRKQYNQKRKLANLLDGFRKKDVSSELQKAREKQRQRQEDILAQLGAVASCFKGGKISNMGLKLSEPKPSGEKIISHSSKNDPVAGMFSLEVKNVPKEDNDIVGDELLDVGSDLVNSFKINTKKKNTGTRISFEL